MKHRYRNLAFFNHCVTQKRCRNRIQGLEAGDGRLVESDEGFGCIAGDYFKGYSLCKEVQMLVLFFQGLKGVF